MILKPSSLLLQRNKLCGYSAPRDQAYVPMGVPVNVIPVIEGLK